MRKITRKLSGFVFVILSMQSHIAFADARAIADSLYGSFTSTGPSSFTTPDGRTNYSGGAYSMRFKTDNISVIDFQAPQVSASCSGIDFFAGSLDMMSKDELIQVGRNIAAAAAIYAFRLSLNSVCASCNSIMSNIQSMMDRVNQLANVNCEKALAAMENFNPSTPQSDTDKSLITTGVLQSTLNEWDDALAKNEQWLDALATENKNLDDIYKEVPELLSTMNDSGYFLAYNTDIYKVLFPYLPEVAGRQVIWSMLSRTIICPDDQNNTDNGILCGVPQKYQFSIKDLYTGAYDTSSNSYKSIVLPKCDSVIYFTSTSGQKYQYCEFTNSNDVVDGEIIEAIELQFKRDVFGDNGVNNDGTLDVDRVCSYGSINSGVDSLFSKMMSFNDDTLTNSQAVIASQIGTTYTRDLYKFSAKKELASGEDAYAKDCGIYADILFQNTERLIAMTLRDTVKNGIPKAKQMIDQDTVLAVSSKGDFKVQLDELKVQAQSALDSFSHAPVQGED